MQPDGKRNLDRIAEQGPEALGAIPVIVIQHIGADHDERLDGRDAGLFVRALEALAAQQEQLPAARVEGRPREVEHEPQRHGEEDTRELVRVRRAVVCGWEVLVFERWAGNDLVAGVSVPTLGLLTSS